MNSKAMQRLQAAGNAVKVATEHLVRAAKQAIDAEDERTLIISQRMVSGIAQVIIYLPTVYSANRGFGEHFFGWVKIDENFLDRFHQKCFEMHQFFHIILQLLSEIFLLMSDPFFV